MKKFITIILTVGIIVFVVFLGVYFINKKSPHQNTIANPPTLAPTITSNVYCASKDVQAKVMLDPGAGNINGIFTIKNIANDQCTIVADSFISANYNKEVITNIAISHHGKSDSKLFELAPNQTVYAKIHYPNGPQCQGPTVLQNITFSYRISPTDTITFADQKGIQKQVIQVCPTTEQVTTIDLWSFSTNSVN